MHLEGDAVRLSIYLGEADRAAHSHRPLYTELGRLAREAGLAGASVFHGVEGFGASSVVHTTRLLSRSEDLPVLIIIVDTAERIDAFLPTLDELITEGLVVIDPVQVVKYVGRPGRG
jgi:PII-like signaling protein